MVTTNRQPEDESGARRKARHRPPRGAALWKGSVMNQSRLNRRHFLAATRDVLAGGSAALALGFPSDPLSAQQSAESKPRTQQKTSALVPRRRATLAQVRTHPKVQDNLVNARKAFDQATRDRADWLLFPEMFLSGYHGQFSQESVAAGMAEIAELCRKHRLAALVGTGWKEEGKTFNQVRVLDAAGELAGVYAKKCLCYGEDQWTTAGTTPLLFELRDLRFGILICNDFWVTPGFSDGPNPHWSLKQARAGAQVIFHHINSGSDQRYRAYHESNHFTRAAEARCPVVAVNAFTPPEVNATSGVVGTDFRHREALPRDREIIQTVEFAPAARA